MNEKDRATIDAASTGLDEYRAGWLYEQVHRPPKKSVFTSFGFWLVFSVLLHAVLFAALSPVIFGRVERRPEKRTIEVEAEMVELRREETVTYRSEIDMSETSSVADDAARLKESLSMGVDDVDVMGVDDMEIDPADLAMLDDNSRPRRSPADMLRDADLTRGVDTGGRDRKTVMNIVSRHVLEDARRRGVSVVLLFDESQSLLRERELMGKQLDRIFEELTFSMSDALERRVEWAVVSFSNQPRLQINPTRDIAKVQQALKNMPVDETGKESVCRAIKWCADEFGSSSRSTMVLVVTDEQGDDIGIDSDDPRGERNNLRETVDLCREKRTRVYVLGREAYIDRRSIWREIENVGGGHLERGLPSKDFETAPRIWHLGMNNVEVPSGFGCYSLSVLADRTGGQFLIIDTEPSIYGDTNLKPFEPERLYPNDYDSEVQKSRWRKTVVGVASEIGSGLPPHERFCEKNIRTQHNAWREIRQGIAEKVRWCDRSADDLLKLGARELREIDNDHRKRWEANRDLVLAQVYQLKSILLQVDGELEDAMGMDRYPIDWPDNDREGIIFRINVAWRDDDARFHEGREQRNALRDARNALEKVAKEYNGTPWGRRAQVELERIQPMRLHFGIEKYDRTRPEGPRL